MAESILVLVVAGYAALATGYLEARRRRDTPPLWARTSGPIVVLLHFAGLFALGMTIGRSPFSTLDQALSFLAFSLAAIYLLLEATSRVAAYGGSFYALAAVIAAVSVPGLVRGDTLTPATASNPARSMHVGLGLLSMAAVLVAGLLALGYLNVYRRMKHRQLENDQGPSLAGFQRLTRNASWVGTVLLLPSLVFGLHGALAEAAPRGLFFLTATVGVLLALLVVASWLWWRRPLKGATAAWLNLAAALLVFLSTAVIHPIVISGGR